MKKHIALFALSAAALMGLSACAGNGGDGKSSSAEDIVSSDVNPSEESSVESSEIDLSVALTIDAPAGVSVDIEDAPKNGKYYAGDEISFTVTATDAYPSNKVIAGVTVNGHDVIADGTGTYYFVMSKNGATIKVSEKTIGDIAIESVKDVDTTKIPALAKEDYGDPDKIKAFCASVGEVLKAGDATHATYLRDCSIDIVNSPLSGYELSQTLGFSGTIYRGKGMVYATGDKIKMEFSSNTGETNNTNKYTVENGYADEDKSIYYTRSTEYGTQGSYYDYGAKGSKDEIFVYKVVNDDAENFSSKTMIKSSDANSHATGFNIGSVFASQVFGDGYSAGLTKTDYYGNIIRQIKEVSSTVAADNKSYTMKVVAYDLSNLDADQFYGYVTEITVDGDGFASKLSIHKYKYSNKEYWDSENGALTANAVAASDSYSIFNLTRGYKYSKDVVSTTDVSKFKMTDYDVTFSVQNAWAGTFAVSTADVKDDETLTFEVGTQIKGFSYTDFTSDTAVLAPTFEGTETDGFLTKNSSNYYVIEKEGETSFLFSSVFGDVKTIPVKFVQPAPHGIDASFDNSVVSLGKSITLTAAVTPSTAEQGITVSLADDDPTESALVEGEEKDGKKTYTITPSKTGSSYVTITSTKDASITKKLEFKVAEAATLDGVKNYLPTVTFANSADDIYKCFRGDYLNINFNADGTGDIAAIYKSSYSSSSEGHSDFTWTIDESSLVVTITQTSAVYGIVLTTLTPVNSEAYTISGLTTSYGDTSSWTNVNVYGCDRVADLSAGPWVYGNAQ